MARKSRSLVNSFQLDEEDKNTTDAGNTPYSGSDTKEPVQSTEGVLLNSHPKHGTDENTMNNGIEQYSVTQKLNSFDGTSNEAGRSVITPDYGQYENDLNSNRDSGVSYEQEHDVPTLPSVFTLRERLIKPRVEDTHTRRTWLVRNDLLKRLDALSKGEPKGFPTQIINQALEALLPLLETEKRNGARRK